jgi:hypothetical protein
VKQSEMTPVEAPQDNAGSQVLADIAHGAGISEPIVLLRRRTDEVGIETRFGYLFPQLKNHPQAHLPADDPARVVAALKALGDAMVEEPPQMSANSRFPPVYTYWGQFIGHDLSANAARDPIVSDIASPDLRPLAPDQVQNKLFNLRRPTLNLDSVYGDGPSFDESPPTRAAHFYDGIKFRIGKVALNSPAPAPRTIPGAPIPPDRLAGPDAAFVSIDPLRDLPRTGALINEGVIREDDFAAAIRRRPNFRQVACIADARNDENLIIAQLHLAFLRFHNQAVDWVKANEVHIDGRPKSDRQVYKRAQQLTRWHHQWLVVNDFLKTICTAGCVGRVLHERCRHYSACHQGLFMPLEFSVAVYRFGHTMVRGAYDYNRNFGRAEPGKTPIIDSAPLKLLFGFTGKAESPFAGATEGLPFNWVIEWDRFVDKDSPFRDRFARKIDTRLAPPLKDIANYENTRGDPEVSAVLKHLARRNLLRGYLLSIPTGQSVARAMNIVPMSADELKHGNSAAMNQVLADNGFLTCTPLWYYILKEAEVRAGGNSLGELGSRIVCETIIGQLFHDPDSYLMRAPDWHPGLGVKLPDGGEIKTIRDFIRFAGLPA